MKAAFLDLLNVQSESGFRTEKINIQNAKTNLSKLIQEVTRTGETLVIAKKGHALVKVITYREEKPKREPGFLKGKGSVPGDFDD